MPRYRIHESYTPPFLSTMTIMLTTYDWYTGLVSESYIRKPNTSCAMCGKAVYRRPSEIANGRVFCSAACYGISMRKERPCVVCGNPILARRNKKTCSRGCANTHRAGTTYKIGCPKDKARTIRTIKLRLIDERGSACGRCGYARVEILQVHHRDRNTSNNDFGNLELICPNCHCEEHYLEKSWLRSRLVR